MRVTACLLSEMIFYLYLSMSSKKQIFLIRNESPRPVWWFVILAWIIMVWSDDKSYCLVSSYIEHCLNYHSDRGRVGLHWPGQTRAEHRASWSKFTGKWSKKISCARFRRFEGGHLPHFWTIRNQENYPAMPLISSHIIFQILSHLSGTLSRNTCYTSSKTARADPQTLDPGSQGELDWPQWGQARIMLHICPG